MQKIIYITGVNLTYIEIFILGIIILIQFRLFFKLIGRSYVLRTIFDQPLDVVYKSLKKSIIDSKNIDDIINAEEEYGINTKKFTYTESKSKNEILLRIKETLNRYLVSNFGAPVNFSIIKDIIDREVDTIDEEISQSISVPLYLGLAATMFGIIIGFIGMPNLSEEYANGDKLQDTVFVGQSTINNFETIGHNVTQNAKENDTINFNKAIDSLINSVSLAMFASLIGLALTTILSFKFYKNARVIVQNKKNNQLSTLQAQLLPELIKAEDTGVSGLKSSLDNFARIATEITQNVKTASMNTQQTIQHQLAVLQRVENLNVTKISKTNLELFDKLSDNMESFEYFSRYLKQMESISKSFEAFAKKTENMESLASEIKNTMDESRKLFEFLQTQYRILENHTQNTTTMVDKADLTFTEVLGTLKENVKQRVEELNKVVEVNQIEIKEVFSRFNDSLSQISDNHISQLTQTYENAVPSFKQLDKLDVLEEFKKETDRNYNKLVSELNKLNGYIKYINNAQERLNKKVNEKGNSPTEKTDEGKDLKVSKWKVFSRKINPKNWFSKNEKK